MNAIKPTMTSHSPTLTRARWMLRIAMGGIVMLVIWSAFGEIDQVTRAQGQVIAVARTQSIQASDGGVVSEIHVKEGETVKQGQLLVTLEKGRAQAAVDDSRAKVAALKITLARLKAEVYGQPLKFASELEAYGEYISNQRDLYHKRKSAIDQDVAALNEMLGLARQELDMNKDLAKTGDVSKADLLRLQRSVADIQAQINNKRNKYFQEAVAEMTKAQEDLNTQQEQLQDRSQLLEHTELVAPANGVVKNIKVTTLGGVVRAGDLVLEILPIGELVVEAKITPSDIANVKPSQEAIVKLDAYDYAIYGTLKGHVSYLSPDTLLDESRQQGVVPYYRVQIVLDEKQFHGKKAEVIDVRPGMTATVEIKAQERTILSYLTKPVTKTISESMGER
ncbi:HlyD family efflux transporter periplasmic adaptor subunit [Limnohabitans sp.]|uniref:HlyD family efflux transporter periplasmic adaptor subunit n=2 Tax=Limnohabitans sp. TaxID=1907725 RepID=UPI00286F5C09|nr:HlyD family efflux transporter periplasmic adaptor subunit [Limnohabitans sp.]